MSEETAEKMFERISSLGCRSVHVGGGEPLLNLSGLQKVLAAVYRAGGWVDYVETNCAWHVGEEKTLQILSELADRGLQTLLVSISPFHNESIALTKVLGVLECCRQIGMQVLPWTADFLADLSRLDSSRPHSLAEMKEVFGSGYLSAIERRYWVHPGGRALDTFRSLSGAATAEEIVQSNGSNCSLELSDTSHFHIDLHRNYIPGLCSGLAFPADLLGKEVDGRRFRVLTLLYTSGIGGLYDWAREEYDYLPAPRGFGNKCDLCNDIRSYLASLEADFTELRPRGHYG